MAWRKHLDKALEGFDRKTGMGLSSVLGTPARYLVPYEKLEQLAHGGEQTLIFECGDQALPGRMIEFVAHKDGKTYGIVASPYSHTAFTESLFNPENHSTDHIFEERKKAYSEHAKAAGFADIDDFILRYYKDRKTALPIRPVRVSNFDIERGSTKEHIYDYTSPGEMAFSIHTFTVKDKIHEIDDTGHAGAGTGLRSV